MKHFMLLKIMKCLMLHLFVASSPSTLYKLMPKSLYNSARLSDTCVKAKMIILVNVVIEIVLEYQGFKKIANINHRFIASFV
jgi:hypothetical protein